MARQPLTIIGDVYVEDFKPVRLKRDTTKKVGVNVYESELTDVDPRTASPGGAALLAHLLVHEIGGIQVVLPIHEQWDIFKLISGNAIAGAEPPILVKLDAPQNPNRVASFYAPSDKEPGDWELQFRFDEVHRAPIGGLADLRVSQFVVLDDHGLGAVRGLLEGGGARGLKPDVLIVSAQHENREHYNGMMQDARTVIVICTERQALMWSGVKDAPPRLPPGPPQNHKQLLDVVFKQIIASFPRAEHIVVNRGNGPLASLYIDRSASAEGAPYGHVIDISSGWEMPEPDTDGTPGVNTLYLAAFVNGLITGLDVRHAVEGAVRSAAIYARDGIKYREDGNYFGRLEELPRQTDGVAIRPSFVITIDRERSSPWADALDFLKRAQLDGRLPSEESVLQDYYAPVEAAKQIKALLRALESYVVRSNKRPFNVLLEADPGSGKSYFAQCLARHLDGLAVRRGRAPRYHPLIEANLSLESERTDQTLAELYEEIRDHRAVGHVPLVLLDEFDTLMPPGERQGPQPDATDRLFARLLAPLWDGVFAVEGKHHRLGGFILLIAVSNPEFSKRLDDGIGKARDFASRIDVRLDLRDTGAPAKDEKMKSNIRIAASMLKKHFGLNARKVQLAVLDAIGRAEFRGRNRAIDQLIMMSSSPLDGTFRLDDLPDEKLWKHIVSHLDVDSAKERYGDSVVELM